MHDLKTVIYACECTFFAPNPTCGNCPYFVPDEDNGWCDRDGIYMDIYNLLKAQEPRVMTLEEVHEISWDYCYLEEEVIEVIKDKALQIYSGKHRISCITWPSIASCTLLFGNEAYGKKWRCWTSRPTDEQRAATSWTEPLKED